MSGLEVVREVKLHNRDARDHDGGYDPLREIVGEDMPDWAHPDTSRGTPGRKP